MIKLIWKILISEEVVIIAFSVMIASLIFWKG